MKLPNSKNIIISEKKLADYILSETHPIGKFKARVFRDAGFNEIHALMDELARIANSQEIKSKVSSSYGTKYIIDGQIQSQKGETIKIRTIWIIEIGQTRPRFITAYPL